MINIDNIRNLLGEVNKIVTEMSDLEKLEDLVEKAIYQKDANQRLCTSKYNRNWILSIIQERDEMRMLELKFKEYDTRGVDIIDFVRILLEIIEHNETETLYIVIGLVDLFKEICESFNLGNHVKSSDILNYVVDVIFLDDFLSL